MAKINSVFGPLDTADLGFTLMHEHILVANWAMRLAFADWLDRYAHVEHRGGRNFRHIEAKSEVENWMGLGR